MEKQRPRGYPEHRQRAALGRGGIGGESSADGQTIC